MSFDIDKTDIEKFTAHEVLLEVSSVFEITFVKPVSSNLINFLLTKN